MEKQKTPLSSGNAVLLQLRLEQRFFHCSGTLSKESVQKKNSK